jgi:hypothetical protein
MMTTVRENLDELISWYEKNKPEAGRTITVQATADTLEKFATLGADGKFHYRDRIIVPLRKSRKQIRAEELAAAAAARTPGSRV